MTQLLISVKDVEESLTASYAGADVIDLKDPSVGALGALDINVVSEIVRQVDENFLLSATIGEGHLDVDELANDIQLYMNLGVNIVKVAASELFYENSFAAEMLKLSEGGAKLVAVFFADAAPDLGLIPKLQKAGFYGAMLDTKFKKDCLLEIQPDGYLKRFVNVCLEHHLISGVAGSVNKSHMNALLTLNASFVGLRGGVCEGRSRTSMLSYDKVLEVKDVLLNYNKNKEIGLKTVGFGLHI